MKHLKNVTVVKAQSPIEGAQYLELLVMLLGFAVDLLRMLALKPPAGE